MHSRSTSFPRSLAYVVSALLFFAPAVNLTWQGGSGYCFFALLAISLGTAFACRVWPGYFSALCEYRWFTVGMLAIPVAVVVQQAVMGYWMPRQFDAISRFALVVFVFLMLRQVPSRKLRAIGWGCAAGAAIAGVSALLLQPTDAVRFTNSYTNAIPFGDTALLLAFLSVFTLGWDVRDGRIVAVKVLAFIGGAYASYLSGTRGGWLAIPFFFALLGFQFRWFSDKKRLLISTLVVVVCLAALFSTDRVRQRLGEGVTDIQLLKKGKDDTSIGDRLQLWTASTAFFAQHPVYGIGKGHLLAALDDMARRGKVSTQVVNERAHSDFFSTLAEQGAIGVLCLLLFYFGSTVYFWRERRAADATIRTAAWSGLAVSFSTIIFGLTIDVLVPVMVTVLVALFSATFLAVIDVRKRELAAQKSAATAREMAVH